MANLDQIITYKISGVQHLFFIAETPYLYSVLWQTVFVHKLGPDNYELGKLGPDKYLTAYIYIYASGVLSGPDFRVLWVNKRPGKS